MSTEKADPGVATAPRPDTPLAKVIAGLSRVIVFWALLGGLGACALALMTTYSAVSNLLFAAPFSADYELMKHVIAVVIFMFLPYCQLVGANVTVDIFTEGMSEAKKAAMGVFSSLFAIAFSLLLLRQMWLGMWSYVRYPEVTPVLQLPLWTAFPPILVSLGLLLIASLITLIDGIRAARGRAPFTHHTPFQTAE
ncbi:TRAP transporter small permease [Amorphus sp. 3PC139-8]|uniref:TRAP transporter small permease n=1 Tax=Amorphus sp. 3PC139-8 TaxID=2735676 RepID=UPI00345DBBC9